MVISVGPDVTAVVTLGIVHLEKVLRGFTYSLVSATKMAKALISETQGHTKRLLTGIWLGQVM